MRQVKSPILGHYAWRQLSFARDHKLPQPACLVTPDSSRSPAHPLSRPSPTLSFRKGN